MCVLVRCTVRRTAPTSRILSRVWRARRSLAWFFALMVWRLSLFLLRLFQHDDFAGIAHALALVGLGGALRPHFGGHLPDELLVDAGDHDLGLRRGRNLDALGHLVDHRVRKAERQVELVALRLRAVADADQREALLEAFGDAGDHVRDQRAHGAGPRIGVVRVAERLEHHLLAFLLHFHVRIGRARDGTERALHRDAAAGEGQIDAFRQRNRVFGDARHGLSLSDDAEHFAADTVGARLAIGHHAPRGREDRHAQPVHHARDVIPALVDAQPRLRDALDALDHRPAGVVLEADGELFLGAAVFTISAAFVTDGEVLDVTLVLQHLGDGALQSRRGHRDLRVADQLRIADAGPHVGDRVMHPHIASPFPARFDDAGHFALEREVAQLVAAQTEHAIDAARPAGERAAVAQAHRRRVARQPLQLDARLV